MKRGSARLRIIIMAPVMIMLLLFGGWRLSTSRTFQLFGELVARVETGEHLVALTFDDGPVPGRTDRVLSLLREHGVKATFFLTGREMEEHPELARMIAAEGHQLGNHTYSHEAMVLKSPAFIEREITRTDSLIRLTGFAGPILFRPPYCKKLLGLPWFLSRTGRVSITWDLEPDSYPEVAAESGMIVREALKQVRPGSIILLHVMYPSRATSLGAVAPLIDSLRERGYRFVTVSELLSMR